MAETRLTLLCALSFAVCWLAGLVGWLLLAGPGLGSQHVLWALVLLVALFTVGLIMLVTLDTLSEEQEAGHGED